VYNLVFAIVNEPEVCRENSPRLATSFTCAHEYNFQGLWVRSIGRRSPWRMDVDAALVVAVLVAAAVAPVGN
jgi:hypothetical protein